MIQCHCDHGSRSSRAGTLVVTVPVSSSLTTPHCPARQELSDGDLLARCREHGRGSEEWAAARDVLVRRYMPLVRAWVRQYRHSPESAEDLMQVGYVGLLKAIGGYDPAFGNGLRAYAVPCITGEIKRHFRDKRWQVRVTRPVQELLLEMRGVTEDLTHELGRLPGEGELAGRLGVSPAELREARRAADGFSAVSLDAPMRDGEDPAALGDLLGDDDAGFQRAIDMEAVERHWDELPRREQRILIMRFYGNLTQEDIAQRLGISQMHVSRLQARALAQLRDRLLGGTPPPG
ncbi:MAG TPA: SigB/SigF/SigG family RNA polymerase sigma factor [Streptosporangiaceae bacterium]